MVAADVRYNHHELLLSSHRSDHRFFVSWLVCLARCSDSSGSCDLLSFFRSHFGLKRAPQLPGGHFAATGMEAKAAAKAKSRQFKGDEESRAFISHELKKTTKQISNINRKVRANTAEDKDYDKIAKLEAYKEKLWQAKSVKIA